MKLMRWVRQQKTAIAIILGLIVLIVAGIWFWGILVGYVNPGTKGATDRKDVVQAFALIVAGVVGLIGGIVGIANLSVSRRNLRQQIQLEDQRRETTLVIESERSQDAVLQAYFEQMGDLLTDHNLIGTERDDVRQLARAQTLTVLARLNQTRKGSLVRFLRGAGLIKSRAPIVPLSRVDLRGAYLRYADLSGADLSEADLSEANLRYASLGRAILSEAIVSEEQLTTCKSLVGAMMPNGQIYADWRKTRQHSKVETEPETD